MSYCKKYDMMFSHIINKLIITPDQAHIADHACKFSAICKNTKSERMFIALFRFAQISGIYLIAVNEIKLG